jgi:undecaprenyl diphosphate synthase
MDGNGRWGIKNKNSRNLGHKEGLNTVQKIINASIEQKISYLTLFVFSTENWKRPKKEINYLIKLLENFLKKKLDSLNNENIKIKIIGKKNFSKKINKLLYRSEKLTKLNNKIQINLALNYGSRSEIINSFKMILKKNIYINEKNVSQNLFTKNIPDPDILIRTGNTNRLSNFLLWQLSYTEIFFEKKLWPDFKVYDYLRIINHFKKIKRNFGSI